MAPYRPRWTTSTAVRRVLTPLLVLLLLATFLSVRSRRTVTMLDAPPGAYPGSVVARTSSWRPAGRESSRAVDATAVSSAAPSYGECPIVSLPVMEPEFQRGGQAVDTPLDVLPDIDVEWTEVERGPGSGRAADRAAAPATGSDGCSTGCVQPTDRGALAESETCGEGPIPPPNGDPRRPPVLESPRSLGTAIHWETSVEQASSLADEQGKLVFVIHVSGNFELPGFT